MKKLLLILLLSFTGLSINAQSDYYSIITGLSTSANSRAPQGGSKVAYGVWIITATEMANGGFVTGDVINSIGFNYFTAQDLPTTSTTFKVYLENVANTVVTNTKSTTWTTAITGMTLASNSNITIPASTGTIDFTFSGGTTFTYNGGSLFVGYEYQNTGTPSTNNSAYCNTAIVGGFKGAWNATGAAITTTAASNFRPETRFGKPVSCSRPTAVTASGITNTSANINFVASGGTTEIQYGVYDFVLGTGTTLANVTSPATISGLSPSTVYKYYLRKNCGGPSGLSAWSGPFTFNTPFQPTNAPYATSFEQESFPYLGWVQPPGIPVGSDWQIAFFGPPSGTNTLTQDGNVSVYSLSGVTTAAANNWILSRGINLNAGNTATISFYTRNYLAAGSTGTAGYNLTVGTAQTVVAQTTNIATEVPFSGIVWVLKTYTYTPTTTGTYYFGIQNTSPANTAGQQALFIDNFTITEPPLSTQKFSTDSFSIYPNPTSDFITITNSNNFNVKTISITDLNGRVVKSSNQNTVSDIQINISDLSSGMYIMNINSDLGTIIKKIVKE